MYRGEGMMWEVELGIIGKREDMGMQVWGEAKE